jgi:hypothetical protein
VYCTVKNVGPCDTLRSIARNTSWTCEQQADKYFKLNYPTIMVPLLQEPYGVYRTVTNVGLAAETYKEVIYEPTDSIQVTVFPDRLTFSSPGEKKSFLVTVNGKGYPDTRLYDRSQHHLCFCKAQCAEPSHSCFRSSRMIGCRSIGQLWQILLSIRRVICS